MAFRIFNANAATRVLPTFDQYHIILASIKLLRLSNDYTEHGSIVLLSQKHIYNGILFKFFDLYGIENHPLNKRRKVAVRKKPVTKVVSTSTISENEPSISQRQMNRKRNDRDEIFCFSKTNEIVTETKPIRKAKKSSSFLDLVSNHNSDSTCVNCLTDTRNVLLLPFRHLCLCGSCAENLKFQSADCAICRVPFRALLQNNALHQRKTISIDRHSQHFNADSDDHDEDHYHYEHISLIDALNSATSTTKDFIGKPMTMPHLLSNSRKLKNTTDLKYFSSEHPV